MLIGQYQHNIDAKNRVIVPAKFREDLGERFYVTKGLDGCLFVLSEEGWKRLQDKIVAMPMSKARQLQRFFFSGAAEVEPDKQGRILIPQPLRDYASIEKDVTFIGTGDRAEKIRTYNVPQGRVTEHRIKLTLYKIDSVMDGELDELIDSLIAADQAAKLAKLNEEV